MVAGRSTGSDVCGFEGDGDVSFVKVGFWFCVGLTGFGTTEGEATGSGGGAWGLNGTVSFCVVGELGGGTG